MINIAIDAARDAGDLAHTYFGKVKNVRYKADNSPVTIADIEAERAIRKIITKNFPDHGIIGEEFPPTKPKAKYKWVIDPIDGTKDFVKNIPLWCTLLAVMENGKPIIGICYFPYSRELFSAQKGKGAHVNGKKTYVSKNSNIKLAYIDHSSIHYFEQHKKIKQMINLNKTVNATRNMSSLGYNDLWKGKSDALINGQGRIWDFAAPAIITEEAGGKYSDLSGKYSFDSNNSILSNGKIHNKILKIINE